MIEIQRLSPKDAYRLQSIRLAALQDAPDAFGTTYQEAAAYPIETWQQQIVSLPTFIAVVDGQDSGMARGAPHPTDPTCASVISLWVAPHARGKNLGTAMLTAVANWARTQECTRLLLEVGDHNTSAIALYTRLGFKSTGNTGHLPPPRTHITEHEMALTL